MNKKRPKVAQDVEELGKPYADPALETAVAVVDDPTRGGTVCGARTKKGTICTLGAGFNTAHPGKGRCFHHSGSERRWYKDDSPTIADKAQEFAADPEVFNLRQEIGKLRAVLEERYDKYHRLSQSQTTSKTTVARLVTEINVTAKTIGDLVGKFHSIVFSRDYALTVEQAQRLIGDIQLVLMRRIEDESLRKQLAEDFRNIKVPTVAAPPPPGS